MSPKYERGGATLYLGDCLEVSAGLAKGFASLAVTDPPYNVVNRSGGDLRKPGYLDKGVADSAPVDIPATAALIADAVGKNGSAYVWCGTEQVSAWRASFVALKFSTRQCAWEKTNPAPINAERLWLNGLELCVFARRPKAPFNRFFETPLWRGPSTPREAAHPTNKPIWLMGECIDASSNIGETIFDPFMGSGSTGVAALRLGRRFVGIEQDPAFFDEAASRIDSELDALGDVCDSVDAAYVLS